MIILTSYYDGGKTTSSVYFQVDSTTAMMVMVQSRLHPYSVVLACAGSVHINAKRNFCDEKNRVSDSLLVAEKLGLDG